MRLTGFRLLLLCHFNVRSAYIWQISTARDSLRRMVALHGYGNSGSCKGDTSIYSRLKKAKRKLRACNCNTTLNLLPWTKKPSSRFAARRTLFHVWYHARSGAISAGQVRSATLRDFCPALIAPDRAWYHTWNSVLLAANLEDGSFFLSRVVHVQIHVPYCVIVTLCLSLNKCNYYKSFFLFFFKLGFVNGRAHNMPILCVVQIYEKHRTIL